MCSLRTSTDVGTMRSLATEVRGRTMKPVGGSTPWKSLARSTFSCERIGGIHGRAAEDCR